LAQEYTPMTRQFTAIIEREGDGFVGLCPELDISSQGDTIEEARANLQEALELLLEAANAGGDQAKQASSCPPSAALSGHPVPVCDPEFGLDSR
jgi:predicted RNase H-like HicB family nuclease